jgi:hypothetical protein
VQKIGLRGRALAEERNVLRTNHLTQAVGPIPGRCGPNPAMERRLGLRRREVSLHKKLHFLRN